MAAVTDWRLAARLGQEENVRYLQHAWAQGELPHTLLFSGPRGSGRKRLALALARLLLCASPQDGEACGVCPSCHYFAAGSHPDLRLLLPGEENLLRVERLRTEVMADLPMLPQISSRKVYLLDGDALNEQGQNALLKSLEEPPTYASFLITVRSPEMLLATIRSRAAEIKMALPDKATLARILQQEGITEKQDFLLQISQIPGEAIALARDEAYLALREAVFTQLRELPAKNELELAGRELRALLEDKEALASILQILQTATHDLGLLLAAAPMEGIINSDQKQRLTELCDLYRRVWRAKTAGGGGTADAAGMAGGSNSGSVMQPGAPALAPGDQTRLPSGQPVASIDLRPLAELDSFLRELLAALEGNVNKEMIAWELLMRWRGLFSGERVELCPN